MLDESPDNGTGNTNRNRLVRPVILLFVLGILGVGYFYLVRHRNQATPPGMSASKILLSTSNNYKEADAFFSQRTYDKAIEKYGTAINDANSLGEEIFIRFMIARATSNAGNNLKAIELFKDIVANPKYAGDLGEVRQAKASAVAALAGIFYQTRERAITEKIFSGKPYEDFVKKEDGGDINTAYRRLLEYASSLSSRPDLVAESRIAMWYALTIYELKHKQIVTEEEKQRIQEYTGIVKTKLAYVDNYVDDPQSYYDNSKNGNLPLVLRYKATALGALMVSGNASLGNPEETFLRALSLPQPPWTRSQTKFAYAVFLAAAYGEKRKDDVSGLLSDVYDPSTDTEFNWHTWLVNEKDHPTLQANTIPILVAVDPKFKAFLLSLGWKF